MNLGVLEHLPSLPLNLGGEVGLFSTGRIRLTYITNTKIEGKSVLLYQMHLGLGPEGQDGVLMMERAWGLQQVLRILACLFPFLILRKVLSLLLPSSFTGLKYLILKLNFIEKWDFEKIPLFCSSASSWLTHSLCTSYCWFWGGAGNTGITYHVERWLFLLLSCSLSLSPVCNDSNYVAFQPIVWRNHIFCYSLSSWSHRTASQLNAISEALQLNPFSSRARRMCLSQNQPRFQ